MTVIDSNFDGTYEELCDNCGHTREQHFKKNYKCLLMTNKKKKEFCQCPQFYMKNEVRNSSEVRP